MKKVFITIISTFLPLMASAAVEIGGIWYILNDNDHTAEVVAFQGSQYTGDFSISYHVYYQNTEYKVTSIGNSAFEGCIDMTSISLPSSLENIGNGAFWQCSSLKSVYIPDGVTTIGEGAFHNCFNLVSVFIPSSVTSIGSSAFSNCNNLSQVISLIQNPFVINSNVFTTYSTTTLVIPKGAKSAYQAKSGWRNFTNIYDGTTEDPSKRTIHVGTAGTLSYFIPEDEKYLVEELTLSGELNGTDICYIRDLSGINYRMEMTGSGYPMYLYHDVYTSGQLKVLDITNANIVSGGEYYGRSDKKVEYNYEYVTITNSISDYMFYGCKLQSINNPSSVTSIGKKAFYGCSGLTSITIPNSVTSIGSGAFDGTAWYNNQPDGLVYAGNVAYNYKGTMPNNTSINIKDGTVGIADLAFFCSDLTSITIPNSVTSIGDGAFQYCSGLTSITIPNSVTSIGESAFSYCSGLVSVTIGSGINYINTLAFAHCENLADVFCLAENVPSTDAFFDFFVGSYVENATLHVPASALNAYKTTAPWSGFGTFETLSGDAPLIPKCATPTISFENGKIKFSCETEGAEFVSNISTTDTKDYYDAELTPTFKYKVTVYATKSGYDKSDTAIAEIEVPGELKGDLNNDGTVNVADHVELTKIIMGQE